MPSSTSLPKAPSSVTFEPLALAEAMHAETGRPERCGGLINRPMILPRDHLNDMRLAEAAKAE